MWPFSKKIETREASYPYEGLILNAIVAQANGGIVTSAGLGALEVACGLWSRAFAGCTVEASERIQQAVTPSVLSLIARNLIAKGEDVHSIYVEDGQLELIPCGSWSVTGGWHEETWIYRTNLIGPSENVSSFTPSDAVVHCRYSVDSQRPWLGVGPLNWGSLTTTLAANLENRLGQESNTPVGQLLPIPLDSPPNEDGTPSPLDQLRKDIGNLRGQAVLLETTSAGFGEGRQASPQSDWATKRLGANIPTSSVELRRDVFESILSQCGIPPGLASGEGSSQGQRESFRQFIFSSVEPIAKIIEAELSKKLEDDIKLNFSNTYAADIAARSSAFKKLVESGMSIEKAAGISGLLTLEGVT